MQNVYVTIQSHALSAGARTHYVTANGVRNGLTFFLLGAPVRSPHLVHHSPNQQGGSTRSHQESSGTTYRSGRQIRDFEISYQIR